ncbi:MAG: SapC family protein [Colwellia sp.]|nr:SapC family protein [Colwellia sp.]
MSNNYAILNNVNHQALKIDTNFSAQYGNDVGSVVTFPSEFNNIQKEYPIFFQKDPDTNQYRSVILLGLQKDENLFLTQGKWQADYIPAIVIREPFLIGLQRSKSGDNNNAAMVHIDLDSPRINTENGQSLFLELGGNSPYLNKIIQTLELIEQGLRISDAMFATFTHYDLIEPVKLDVTLNNDQQYNIKGNYTINKEKLAKLKGEDLEQLNRRGFLQAAFLVMSSMDNMYKLINKKNELIAQKPS